MESVCCDVESWVVRHQVRGGLPSCVGLSFSWPFVSQDVSLSESLVPQRAHTLNTVPRRWWFGVSDRNVESCLLRHKPHTDQHDPNRIRFRQRHSGAAVDFFPGKESRRTCRISDTVRCDRHLVAAPIPHGRNWNSQSGFSVQTSYQRRIAFQGNPGVLGPLIN